METVLEFYLGTVEAERRKNKRLAAAMALSEGFEHVGVRDFIMD